MRERASAQTIRAPGDLSRFTATLLDTSLRIPGTSFRIGLDPIIGLIPGVGDAIAAALGSIILVEAARNNLPSRLLLRMGGNIFLNAAGGVVPVLGDLFSAWFRSNSRNYAILKGYLNGHINPPGASSTKWIAAGCVLFLTLLGGACVAIVWLLAWLWKHFMA